MLHVLFLNINFATTRGFSRTSPLHFFVPYTLGFSQASFQEELAAAWSGAIGFSKKQALISGMALNGDGLQHGQIA